MYIDNDIGKTFEKYLNIEVSVVLSARHVTRVSGIKAECSGKINNDCPQ